MSELKKKLNTIMQDIEKNVKNKEDLEYIKSQVYNISLIFLDEMDKLAELNCKKLNALVDKEKELARKVANVEKEMDNIQKDIYISSDYDFEIVCPYCNEEFVEDFSNGIKNEIRCPECDNVIELDWHEEDGCSCGCGNDECECDGDCNCEEDCDCNENEENTEDDM